MVDLYPSVLLTGGGHLAKLRSSDQHHLQTPRSQSLPAHHIL